jgi:type I restriction enzyme S subunit
MTSNAPALGTRVPADWKSLCLGDLCVEKGAYGANTPKAAFDPRLPRYVRITDISADGRLLLNDLASISEDLAAPHILEPGDVLLARSGATVGKSYVHDARYGRCAHAGYLIRFRTRRECLLPDFLKQFLQSPMYWKWVGETQRAQAQPNINAVEFAALRIPTPSIGEQRKIAAILASVDEAIVATQAVIEQLQVVNKAMMAELLTRGLPGRHTRFKQTEIGEVPEEWTLTTIGDLASFAGGNGFRPPDWSTTGLPIIRIQNLNGSQDFNYYASKPDPDWIVEPGQLLFAWAGSRGASFGPCLWPGPRGVLNQHIHRITPGSRVLKKYLYYLLRLVTEAVEKKAHGFKDTLVHLKKAELTGWPVAIPSIAEQEQIRDMLLCVEARAEAERTSLDGLQTAKSALMSVLLTGEVRVKPDPEPA